MEALEFFLINGTTCICRNGVAKKLTPEDRDEVVFMLEKIGDYFPDALKALKKLVSASEPNRRWYEYRMVDRFIRCNFGEADFLRPDVEMDMFHIEEVRCPLRGICEHEGVICKPKLKLPMTEAEQEVATLYSKGCTPVEIATRLKKSVKTVKNQLTSVTRRLRLDRTRDLIKLLGLYEITT